ncbi:MAG: peptidase M20, partial [Dehalococcoidia bacterium]
MTDGRRVDWDVVTHEAVALLAELIAVDTSNPPGNEIAACDMLGRVLRREGIPYDLYESAPGRVNLVARLRGDGTAGPVILLNHTD